MRNKEYLTVGTIPKSNRKIAEGQQIKINTPKARTTKSKSIPLK
jgi:hypothetical protein